ncbi:MAG TPA: PAS domain-containing sensor histidine kinase [Myxococcaceae bacterium]|nr:PAS domain-containing sensor histidine kinase [Myxococcaceae bacterium]
MSLVPAPRAEALSELITDAYYIVDADDRIVSYNMAFRKMFGRSRMRTLREARCRDASFLPCHGDQCFRERCAAEGVIHLYELETAAADAKGNPIQLRLNVTAGPVTLPNGQPGTMIILREVTDETAVAARYQQAQAVQQQLERQRREALAQMVAGMTDELKTLLDVTDAAAAAMLGRLESGELKEIAEIAEALGVIEDLWDLQLGVELIRRNLLRVGELIVKLRKLGLSQIVDVRQELDLGLSTWEALRLWSREAKMANLKVDVIDHLTPGLPWEGFAGHFSQVVIALLSNVKMHAYPDGKGGRIEVLLSAKAGPPPEFSVAVRDFGAGISPDVQAKIFEPFFTTARKKGCTGLGLSIAQHIVADRFGGTLTCESRPGAGATFTATFSHCPGSSHPTG